MKTIDQAPLDKREHKAVSAAKRTLQKNFGVKQIILFGSKARGDADKDSDIDLIIIVEGSVHWKDEKAIVECLFDIGIQHDVIFSPLVVSTEEWESEQFKSFQVFCEIQRDGAVVQ